MKRILVSDVIEATVKASGIDRRSLMAFDRRRAVASWRQAAFAVARDRTASSYPAIAMAFGRTDHTTAIHGERRARDAYPHLILAIKAVLPFDMSWRGRLEDLPIEVAA